MNHYQNISVSNDEGIFTLTLTREQKRNAIDEQTMDELLEALKVFPSNGKISMAILRAKGKDFCAGADLDWMRNTQQMSEEELRKQNMKLQKIFELWYDLPAFTIAMVHGNVVGGGIGLVAASDLVLARPDAKFRFSEVTLGLMPATIAPFVVQRTQSRFIRNAMLTAIPFDTHVALEHGLVDIIADSSLEQSLLDEYWDALGKTEAEAVSKTKKLINDLAFNRINEPLDLYTTTLLASVRKSESAAKRIKAFFKSIEK
jgi:methylglutaconyl-CoA hydratase